MHGHASLIIAIEPIVKYHKVKHSNTSEATTIVPVRIRARIIEVHVEHAGVGTIAPVTTTPAKNSHILTRAH